jgi:hypothetical protein
MFAQGFSRNIDSVLSRRFNLKIEIFQINPLERYIFFNKKIQSSPHFIPRSFVHNDRQMLRVKRCPLMYLRCNIARITINFTATIRTRSRFVVEKGIFLRILLIKNVKILDSLEPEGAVNLSAPRPEGRGLLKVHPEPRFHTCLKRRGFPRSNG